MCGRYPWRHVRPAVPSDRVVLSGIAGVVGLPHSHTSPGTLRKRGGELRPSQRWLELPRSAGPALEGASNADANRNGCRARRTKPLRLLLEFVARQVRQRHTIAVRQHVTWRPPGRSRACHGTARPSPLARARNSPLVIPCDETWAASTSWSTAWHQARAANALRGR